MTNQCFFSYSHLTRFWKSVLNIVFFVHWFFSNSRSERVVITFHKPHRSEEVSVTFFFIYFPRSHSILIKLAIEGLKCYFFLMTTDKRFSYKTTFLIMASLNWFWLERKDIFLFNFAITENFAFENIFWL